MSLISARNLTLVAFLVIGFVLIGSNGFGVDAEKEIPMTKFSQNVGGPTMSILYW